MADTNTLMLVLAEPFMQRALLGGLLTGALGGVLGSVAVLRQLSFFSDALGHSALLGITFGILIGVNPTLILIPFAVIFAILVNELVERSSLPTDALLNIVYSSSLAAAILALSLVEHYRGNIRQLLFGDILGVSNFDLVVVGFLLAAAVIYLGLSLRPGSSYIERRACWSCWGAYWRTGSLSLCCWRLWLLFQSRQSAFC